MRVNLINRRFKKLLVIRPTKNRDSSGSIIWECVCDCGNKKLVSSKLLLSEATTSCGCNFPYKILSTRKEKKCSRCEKVKPINEYFKNRTAKDRHCQYCKTCNSIIVKNNRWKYRARVNKYLLKKYYENIEYRLIHSMRNRVRLALCNNQKFGKTLDLLGCSVEELKIHLSSKFTKRMDWKNYGSRWEIDHVIPCAAFDLSSPEQQKKCFHFTNLQPLEGIDNRRKGDKYEK